MEIVNIAELAEILETTEKKIRQVVKAGSFFEPRMIGSMMFWRKQDVDENADQMREQLRDFDSQQDGFDRDAYYTPQEIAQMFKVKVGTVSNWKRTRQLPEHVTHKHRVYWPKESIDAILA